MNSKYIKNYKKCRKNEFETYFTLSVIFINNNYIKTNCLTLNM